MNKLHVTITKYLRELVEFFKENKNHFMELYGTHNITDCMNVIRNIAIENFEEFGEPNLTEEQFIEVRARLDGSSFNGLPLILDDTTDLFVNILGHLPYCLN